MQFRLPGRPWFKPRTHGFGASPVTWEGWAFTVAYLAGVVVLAAAAFKTNLPPEAPTIALFAGGTAVLTAVYVFFAWLKTDGRWRWRWGVPGDGHTEVKIVSTRSGRRRR